MSFVALALSSCATTKLSGPAPVDSDPKALDLIAASRQAQGEKAFRSVRDLTVRYEGRWASLGPRLQPVLSDTRFRRSSVEQWTVGSQILAQIHQGPAGRKVVVRRPGGVEVSYDGEPAGKQEVKQAAALVADAYTLFLLGPFYFDRPGVVAQRAGQTTVDGATADQVMVMLRPGLGFAEEDRVLLSIDRATKRLVRVRFTLNGLESTQGAEVDVTFRDFRRVQGLDLPTTFVERIRAPLRLPAHRWKREWLRINRAYDMKQLERLTPR